MKRIRMTPNPSGAYPAIQEGSFCTLPEDMALWPDELSTDVFYAHNGFVILGFEKVTEDVATTYHRVSDCQPNTELFEAWEAAEAEKAAAAAEIAEEPTQLDRVEAQATYTAMMTDTLLEV